jgi:hypothetical protein
MIRWTDMDGGAAVAFWPERTPKGRPAYGMARVEANGDTAVMGENWIEPCRDLDRCRRGRDKRGQCETCWRAGRMRLGESARHIIELLAEMCKPE